MRTSVLGLSIAMACLVGCASQRGTAPVAPLSAPGPVGTAAAAGDPGGAQPIASVPARRSENADGRWVSAATASDFVLAGASEEAFGVFVDVPAGASPGHVPTALTLTIDTSGSMLGAKMDHAREAAKRLVQELEDGDVLSVVTFADGARLRVAPTVIDARSRRTALAVIDELTADGGTAMFEGLKVAESQLWGAPDSHLVRRMVVISDGIATEGPTSPDELARVAEVGLQRGIQVTAIGVGLDYDEHTLDALAVRTSGRLYHVEHSEQLAGIVAKEVGLLESTAAAEVEVELVAAPGVRLVGTDAAQARWTDTGIVIPIGTVYAGQQRELLVKATIDGAKDGTKVLASVRLHFRDPAEDGLRRVQETVLRATVTDDPSLVAAHRNSRTQTLLAMRDAAAVAQLASQQANAGELEEAEAQLAMVEKKLEAQAATAETREEKDRVMRSAERISRTRSSLSKAKKAPAAARATAGRKAALDLNDEAMDAFGF
jgi:Ca-activated chloride channel family protein